MKRSRVIRNAATLAVFALAAAGCGTTSRVSPSTDATAEEAEADEAAVAETEPAVTEVDAPVETTSPTTAPPETNSTTTTTAPGPRAYDFAEVSAIVETFVAEQGLSGAGLVIVERDDGVVLEEYWGEFDAERISLVASSSRVSPPAC